MSFYDWKEKGNLDPLRIPVKLRYAIDNYTRGFAKGEKDRYDDRKRKNK
jgi:hypothetical protein